MQGGSLFRLVVVALCVLALVVIGVGLYEPVRRLLHPVTAPPVPPAEHLVARPPDVAVIRAEVDALLESWGYTRAGLNPLSAGVPGYEVGGAFPGKTQRGEIARSISALGEGLHVEADAAQKRLVILWRTEPQFLLWFRPPPVLPSGRGKVRVAIIMDDLGRDLAAAKRLLSIDAAITFAVLPGEAHAREVAEQAYRRGREILIHLPMEPEGYPEVNPGADALFVGQSAEETQARVNSYRRQVPHAVGGNNHMGSRYTADRQGMRRVLGLLRDDGLFFVDSRTTSASVALAEGRNLGMAVAGRDIFLDNEADVAKITAQLEKLVKLAQNRGQGIGIGHPYPETLTALERFLPRLRQRGVEVVAVSALLESGAGIKGQR